MKRDVDGIATFAATPDRSRPVALGRTAIQAAVASWVGNASGFALRFALNAALARHVGPSTVGVYALGFSYSELLGIICAVSFPQALVQLDHGRRRLFGTVLWMTIATTLSILPVAVLVEPFIRARHGDAVARAFLALVALRTLMGVAACVEGEMQRAYSYGRLAIIRVASIASSAVPAYLAVANGWHLRGLFLRDAVPLAVVLLVGGLSAVRANGVEVFRIDRRTASEVWSFGWALFSVRGLEMIFTRLDELIVGVVLGTRELGLYSQARYLAILPNVALAPATNAVGLRVMSSVRDNPAQLGRTYSVLQYGLARVAIAAGVACFVAPDLVIVISFGPDWIGAADILRALSPWVVLLPLFEIEKALLLATRDWRAVRVAYVAKVLTLAGGTWALAHVGGTTGVALAGALALLGGFLLLRASSRRTVRAERGNYWPAVVSAAIGIAAGGGWRYVSTALPPLAEAAAAVALAGATYVAVLLLLERKRLLVESRYLMGHLFGRRARRPEPTE